MTEIKATIVLTICAVLFGIGVISFIFLIKTDCEEESPMILSILCLLSAFAILAIYGLVFLSSYVGGGV